MDIEIQAKEIMYHKANLNGIMAEYTGQPIEKVQHSATLAQARSAVLVLMVALTVWISVPCAHAWAIS